MIPIEEARNIIASRLNPPDAVEVDLSRAPGLVLAENAIARAHYPAADLATMDGYVIGADEAPGSFRVIGEIPAGRPASFEISTGEAARIFTGGLLPAGGGRVIMQEDVIRDGDRISIRSFSENPNLRRKGSEANPGDIVLPAGSRLDAAGIAILAQIGWVKPKVFRRPVIRHLATGDELVDPADTPVPGQIRDSNSSLLAALLGTPLDSVRVGDDSAAIVSGIAAGDWDLLLVSGGASVGDHDFGAEALRRTGFEIHFDRVNLRPGKPLTFATRGKQAAFIIPGNPVSHFVCYHLAIRLAVECLMGAPAGWDFLPLEIRGGRAPELSPRDTFWPATVHLTDGELFVSLNSWSTSGDTFGLAGTNALARVNSGSPRNGLVDTLLLNPFY